jgi:hypothetical protein
MAIPLFIFAATACLFIEDRRRSGDPEDRFQTILKYQTRSQKSNLDATYLPVLDQMLIGLDGSERKNVIEEFKEVVGSIALLASPIPAVSLARLLGISIKVVDSRLDLLHSVLNIPSDPKAPVKLHHLSFRDFLVDPDKRDTNQFWVDEKQAHRVLVDSCIRLMSASFDQDISGLSAPGVLVTDVESSRVDEWLPPEVQYACLFWIEHLQKSGAQLYDNDQVHQFLEVHLLHWLEALSWMRKISEGILAITSLESIVLVSQLPTANFPHSTSIQLTYHSEIRKSPLIHFHP